MKNLTSLSFENTNIFKKIIKGNLPCYFVSPHLDDAVFSCANLLAKLIEKGIDVKVVNVFTKASPWPYTLSVYKFLWQCRYTSADKLFQDRLNEDRNVIHELGASVINLSFVDALWRRHSVNGICKLLSYFIGEVSYVYPMYRYGLAQGIVSNQDTKLYSQIGQRLIEIIKNTDSVIFCPLAIGRHVDHLIVRDVCRASFAANRLVYWSDYPYEHEKPLEKEFIVCNKLNGRKLVSQSNKKNTFINGYKSQLNVIFGGVKDHSNVVETYYLNESKNV